MRATTSASNVFRRKLCPGSHHAEANVADDGGNEAADEGTLLHPFACNRKLARDHLTEPQRTLLANADYGTEELIHKAVKAFDLSISGPPATWIEERLDVIGPDGEKLYDGQSDIAMLWSDANVAAIQDFKLGFVEVTAAESNYQVASYGVAWSDYLSTDRILVAINQPRKRRDERLTTAVYDKPGIEKARRELAAIVHAAEDLNAPRIAGEEQCRFCRAKLFCDAYKARFAPLATRPEAQTIAMLDTPELHRLGVACKTADRIKRSVFDEIRVRILADEMPGWELKETGEARALSDVVAAYRELSSYFENIEGFDGKAFTDCTDVSWTRLTSLVRRLTGFPEPRAKALINELLNPFIVRTPKNSTPRPIE